MTKKYISITLYRVVATNLERGESFTSLARSPAEDLSEEEKAELIEVAVLNGKITDIPNLDKYWTFDTEEVLRNVDEIDLD